MPPGSSEFTPAPPAGRDCYASPMPIFERDEVRIHWSEVGAGYPVLLFAPGGMRSAAEIWGTGPFDPRRELAQSFRVISMDQRNAGQSTAPVTAADGWHTYAADHLALLDHLGIETCHLMGGCIGSSYCLGVLEADASRVSAAVPPEPDRSPREPGSVLRHVRHLGRSAHGGARRRGRGVPAPVPRTHVRRRLHLQRRPRLRRRHRNRRS